MKEKPNKENLKNNIKAYMSLKETAEYLSVSIQTITKLIKRKGLPAVKVSGQYRIAIAELEKYLQERKVIY